MERFRQIVTEELIFALVPAVVVAVILLIAFWISPRILSYLEMLHSKRVVFVILAMLFLLNLVWAYSRTSNLILDLRENAFVTYTGEIEYLSGRGSKATDIYQLNDSPDSMVVEANKGMVDATIQKCNTRIIYSKYAKIVLEFEVYEITERREAITIY